MMLDHLTYADGKAIEVLVTDRLTLRQDLIWSFGFSAILDPQYIDLILELVSPSTLDPPLCLLSNGMRGV